jgi:hypothetical protein
MEPEGSVPSSQELSTCTYPELTTIQSTPLHLISTRSNLILSAYLVLIFLVVYFPLAFLPITYTPSFLPHSCHMPRPSHPPRLDNSNYTWWRVQITKLLIIPFSLLSALKQPQCVFLPYRQRPCLTQPGITMLMRNSNLTGLSLFKVLNYWSLWPLFNYIHISI